MELVKDRATKEPLVPWHGAGGLGIMKGFYAELRKRGVFTFGKFNVTMVSPPLTVEKPELDAAFEAVDGALTAFAKTL
jgi:taurine---2-oxoglutarate transaminase